jgi:membrane protein implicated in regulation of membrane protease activity
VPDAAGEDAGRADASPDPAAPDLLETLRQVGDGGKSTWQAGRDAAKALRLLVAADISLARSAFGRTLACTGAAIAFGGSAWLLLMGALVAGVHLALGWSWTLSLLATGVLSLALAALAGWGAMRYFEHTRLKATRRQLARLGIGELSKLMPAPDSGVSAQAVTERVAEVATQPGAKVKQDGVEITPP